LSFTAILVLIPSTASAQLNSKTASVNLSAALTSSVTITAAPGLVNFALLRSGVSTGSAPVSITTSWTVPFLFGNVNEYAYFTTSAAATDGWSRRQHPFGKRGGKLQWWGLTAFTGTSPFAAGSSMTLFDQFIFIFNFVGTAHRFAQFENQYDGFELTGRHLYRPAAYSSSGVITRHGQHATVQVKFR